jgi:hypothetical protein
MCRRCGAMPFSDTAIRFLDFDGERDCESLWESSVDEHGSSHAMLSGEASACRGNHVTVTFDCQSLGTDAFAQHGSRPAGGNGSSAIMCG